MLRRLFTSRGMRCSTSCTGTAGAQLAHDMRGALKKRSLGSSRCSALSAKFGQALTKPTRRPRFSNTKASHANVKLVASPEQEMRAHVAACSPVCLAPTGYLMHLTSASYMPRKLQQTPAAGLSGRIASVVTVQSQPAVGCLKS